MTATSSTRPGRRIRLASMEALGFSESPLSTTVVYHSDEPETAVQVPTTLMVHPQAPTGHLVQDLWDSTELVAPSLADWEPQELDRGRLRGGNLRWSKVALTLILGTALGIGAFLLTGRAAELDQAGMETVTLHASELGSALGQMEGLGQQLSATEPAVADSTTVLLDVDDAARDLFAASAELPGTAATTRALAADASGLSLDATRQIRDALAYRGALDPILVPPALETDPALTDLAGAALLFTEWRSVFETTLTALPEGVAVEVGEALDTLNAELDSVQTAYVDAIRAKDGAAATAVVAGLEADLAGIRERMLASMEGLAGEVESELGEARDLISRLVG